MLQLEPPKGVLNFGTYRYEQIKAYMFVLQTYRPFSSVG